MSDEVQELLNEILNEIKALREEWREMRELRKKGENFKTLESENSYLLGRIQSKLSEYDAKLSDCLKNNKKIKKHLRDLQEQQVKNLFLLEK